MKRKLIALLLILGCVFTLPGLSALATESAELKFEGESTYFTMTDNAGVTVTKEDSNGTNGCKWAWNPGIKQAQKVSGKLPYFRSGGIGATVDYEITLDAAANYDLYWAYRPKNESYSTVQVLVNGVEVGAPISQKSGDVVAGAANIDNTVRKTLIGTAAFVEGKNIVTFMLVGAGPNETNTAFTVDYFSLADATGTPGELPETEEQEEKDPFLFEAESTPFTVTDSEGVTATVSGESKWAWKLNITGASLVSGDLAYFRSGGIGGTVDYTVTLDEAGEHSVVWAYRPHSDSYSTVQVLVNGKEIGGAISQKSGMLVGGLMNGWLSNVRTVTLGNADFKKGENTVTFKLVGAGASDETSAFTIDYIKLGDPVDESTLTFTSELEIPKVATKENSTPATVTVPEGMLDTYPGVKAKPATTDKITVYPLADVYKQSEQYKLTVDGVEVPIAVMANDQYEFASFDYDPEKGPLTVVVECDNSVRNLTVSPQHMNVECSTNNKKITLTVTENYNYDLTINGKHLCISADPMQTDVPAASGEGIFNITAAPYSVDPSKMTDKQVTEAIQQALDDASAYGSVKGHKNGVVYIPAGLYYVGNLVIASNTFLYLEGGATMRITSDTSLTKVHGNKTSMDTPSGGKGLDYTWWITTYAEEQGTEVIGSYDIRIGGRGVLDGRDSEFWSINNPGSFQYEIGNNTVIPIACSYFTMEGLTIREGICWSVIAVRSDHMTFEWLKMYQLIGYRQYEDDCIDICESQNVVVRNCIGYSRDDSFSTKTWPYKTGITINWAGVPEYLADVTFEDCMAYSKCFGYKVGQGSNQNQYDVTFRDCVTVDAARGMGVHLLSGEGTVSNIVFENCYIEKINSVTGTHCVWFYVYTQPNARGNGNAENIILKNVYVYKEAIGEKTIEMRGHDAASGVDGVTFDHVYFDGKLAESLDDLQPGLNQNEFVVNVKVENSAEEPVVPDTGDDPETSEKPDDPADPADPSDPGDVGSTDTPDASDTPADPQGGDPADSEDGNGWIVWVAIAAGAIVVAAVIAMLLKKRK
ncbi:MAG: hypothetical protein IJX47_05575 [Clostridia bacterium]|nr:hypothetical protein [Clostridia bacterium]